MRHFTKRVMTSSDKMIMCINDETMLIITLNGKFFKANNELDEVRIRHEIQAG